MDLEVKKRDKREVKAAASEHLVDPANAYSPDTNVYETSEAIIFALDIPGVPKGKAALEFDESNTLIIRGETSFQEPEGKVSEQFPVGDYYRAFSISSDMDKDNISAKLENGVLEITIPRTEKSKPRRIQLSA